MARRPSGFDDQPGWVDAAAAVALLDVKRDTLYAYVSRGLVRRTGARGHHRYAREDLERLKARHDARSGHGPVAAGALRWGEAVLTSSVSTLDARGPRYRTRSLDDLLAAEVPFERVATLLWTGSIPDTSETFSSIDTAGYNTPSPLDAFVRALAFALPDDPTRDWIAVARARIATLASVFARWLGAPVLEGSIAARAIGDEGERARIVDRALVIVAEHELNPSTFAARIAASAGAGLTACLLAAAATMTGPRHGRMSDALEDLLAAPASEAAMVTALRAEVARGGAIPGFGHPMYPQGDPRAAHLFAMADALAVSTSEALRLRAALAVLRDLGHAPPNLDAGLVALRIALGLPRGSAAGLFALGRTAGWAAHAMEQRADPSPLRPRARS